MNGSSFPRVQAFARDRDLSIKKILPLFTFRVKKTHVFKKSQILGPPFRIHKP